MGVFEFVVVLVTVSTIGKVVMNFQNRPAPRESAVPPEELLRLNEAVSEMSSRLEKLEEERNFYRALLEPADRASTLAPPTVRPPEPPPGGRAPHR